MAGCNKILTQICLKPIVLAAYEHTMGWNDFRISICLSKNVLNDLWFFFYKTSVVKIEIQKGTELDKNVVISGFFFHKIFIKKIWFGKEKSKNNCISVHLCAFSKFHLHSQCCIENITGQTQFLLSFKKRNLFWKGYQNKRITGTIWQKIFHWITSSVHKNSKLT